MNDQNNFDDIQLILNQFRKKNPSTTQVARWKRAVFLTQQNNSRGDIPSASSHAPLQLSSKASPNVPSHESSHQSSQTSSSGSLEPRVIMAKSNQGFSWSQLVAASVVGFTIGALLFGHSIFLQTNPSENDSAEIALQSPGDATFEHIITKN